VWQGIVRVMQHAGYDGEFGFRLPGELLSMGLDSVGGEVRAPIFGSDSPSIAAHRFTLEHLRGSLIELGVPEDELAREIAALDDPRMLFSLPSVIVAAWARRPETARAPVAGAMPERRETMVERLGRVPLLETCTAEELNRIATLVEEIEVPAGEVLTHEGAREAFFYVVATGTATVTREGQRLTTLGPGAFFGEVALLTRGPRTATVRADTAMKLLRLDERRFTALLGEAPSVSRKILEGVAKRLGES
jgi:hypothetical protein